MVSSRPSHRRQAMRTSLLPSTLCAVAPLLTAVAAVGERAPVAYMRGGQEMCICACPKLPYTSAFRRAACVRQFANMSNHTVDTLTERHHHCPSPGAAQPC